MTHNSGTIRDGDGRISELLLERYLADDLSAEKRRLVEERCAASEVARAQLDELKASREQYYRDNDSAQFAHQVAVRVAFEAPLKRRRRWWLWLGGPSFATAAVLMVALSVDRQAPAPDDFAPAYGAASQTAHEAKSDGTQAAGRGTTTSEWQVIEGDVTPAPVAPRAPRKRASRPMSASSASPKTLAEKLDATLKKGADLQGIGRLSGSTGKGSGYRVSGLPGAAPGGASGGGSGGGISVKGGSTSTGRGISSASTRSVRAKQKKAKGKRVAKAPAKRSRSPGSAGGTASEPAPKAPAPPISSRVDEELAVHDAAARGVISTDARHVQLAASDAVSAPAEADYDEAPSVEATAAPAAPPPVPAASVVPASDRGEEAAEKKPAPRAKPRDRRTGPSILGMVQDSSKSQADGRGGRKTGISHVQVRMGKKWKRLDRAGAEVPTGTPVRFRLAEAPGTFVLAYLVFPGGKVVVLHGVHGERLSARPLSKAVTLTKAAKFNHDGSDIISVWLYVHSGSLPLEVLLPIRDGGRPVPMGADARRQRWKVDIAP